MTHKLIFNKGDLVRHIPTGRIGAIFREYLERVKDPNDGRYYSVSAGKYLVDFGLTMVVESCEAENLELVYEL